VTCQDNKGKRRKKKRIEKLLLNDDESQFQPSYRVDTRWHRNFFVANFRCDWYFGEREKMYMNDCKCLDWRQFMLLLNWNHVKFTQTHMQDPAHGMKNIKILIFHCLFYVWSEKKLFRLCSIVCRIAHQCLNKICN